jgi:hypothetical protein
MRERRDEPAELSVLDLAERRAPGLEHAGIEELREGLEDFSAKRSPASIA